MLKSAQETLLEMVRRGENEEVIRNHNEIIREMLEHKSRSPSTAAISSAIFANNFDRLQWLKYPSLDPEAWKIPFRI
jgi:hypothetical protein